MFGLGKTGVELLDDADDAAGGGALRYAGFWARVAALIVDNAIVTIFGLALIVGASFAGEAATLIATLVCFLVALLYWPLLECSARQATFGKQLLGIQVTDMEGGRLSFVRSLLRNLAKIISSIPLCIGFLLAGFTARKQALHDMIVSCLVVRSGPSHLFRAVAASVLGLIVIFGGMAFYAFNVYLPQQKSMAGAPIHKDMDRARKGAQQSAPVPAPQSATATPPAPGPVPQVAVVTPEVPPATAPAPAPAPAPKAVASAPEKPEAAAAPAAARAAPAKPAAVEVKPAPAKPAAVATAAAAPPAKPDAPAVKPKPKPKPAPTSAAELVSEPPADRPQPVRRTAAPRPAADFVAPVPPAPPRMGVVVTPKYNDVMTAVMYRDAAGITQLLDLGWWVDRPDTNGVSPLMAAAWIGDAAIVQLLLQRGADPNQRARGGSVLEYAGRSEDSTVIELVRTAGAR